MAGKGKGGSKQEMPMKGKMPMKGQMPMKGMPMKGKKGC